MRDFLTFRRMLTPILIQIIFWIGIILCIATAVVDVLGPQGWLQALKVIVVGPIVLRISCELLILFFSINDSLTDIKNSMSESKQD